MEWSILFFLNNILLGIGLAMDAFSVSLANGLNEPAMKTGRMTAIAGVYAGFQALMPLTGWFCVKTVMQLFEAFTRLIPWIGLALLGYIGVKMIVEGVHGGSDDGSARVLTFGTLMIQGIATSIDALSVGFTIADYGFAAALVSALIIASVTFVLCLGGLALGKRFGTRLAGRASILGGVILIGIGIEIFLKGLLT